jgi:hypothetical protein
MTAIDPGCVWTKIPFVVDYHVPRGRKKAMSLRTVPVFPNHFYLPFCCLV